MSHVSDETRWHGILLDPLDVLFFRDGRPFDAANRVMSGHPAPQTVAGAIRTALLACTGFSLSRIKGHQGSVVDRLREAGADEAILAAEFRGPWFATPQGSGKTMRHSPVFACPMNLRRQKNDSANWLIGRPRNVIHHPLPGWHHPDGLWPIEYPGHPDPKADPAMLTLGGLNKYLSADASCRQLSLERDVDFVTADQLFGIDHRIGIGIDSARLTTIKGELYGIGLMALKPGVKIYLEAKLPRRLVGYFDDRPDGTLAVPVGGEGRYAKATITAPCNFRVTECEHAKSLRYLATPTFLCDRNSPGRPLPPSKMGTLKAATSDRGQAVSGWDISRGGPRKTRFFVPSGAVYFFEGTGNDDGLMEESEQTSALLQEGWGFSIQGTWS